MQEAQHLPIALFDSGVGGLTVFKALARRLPAENLLYLGDTARLPYGTKGRETIIQYTLLAARALVERGVKMLVVACNTATAAALPTLRREFAPLPVVGVVEPGAAAAARASENGEIVVIATEATIAGGAYQEAIARIRPAARVRGQACTLFVPMAEEGWMEGPIVEGVARRYLDGLFTADEPAHRPDTLVLGCTHFPLLLGALQNVVGPGVTIVDSAATTAESVEGELRARGLLNPGAERGTWRFLTTDNPDRFARTGGHFLGSPLMAAQIELVDL
ncbi:MULTISPECIES: glutamate racemase [unclassified Desulfovibrio]|uniref:glutamate racemase n=1 Tax=unclassified Desulfovibrio TaxID=2593640 RepID=UPI0013EDC429|nr:MULTISPECIES: glutamate racemase [unclassified Desulfovibrio]